MHSATRRLPLFSIALLVFIGAAAAPARADNDLVGGLTDVVQGALAIPVGAIAGTLGGPPLIGTVGGALQGALNALGYTTRGVLRLVGVAVPTAASLAPLIPLFL